MSVDILHSAITVDVRDNLPTNAPYGVEGMKKFIFLHGANVSEPNAEIWGDQLFKRLWHTGCQVDFYNVDWRSDIGSGANYREAGGLSPWGFGDAASSRVNRVIGMQLL